jgi:meso-butanediol dehydrogenase / (S,S)-butanediol dehydrogenase / diacetyl reductase
MRGIAGRVSVVTGSARGIGRAIALRLANEGSDVIVSDLDFSGADRVASDIRSLGRHAVAVQADVTVAADRLRLVTSTLETLGRLDILVNNAGIVHVCDPLKITEEDWDRIQAVNLKGTYFMCQVALPYMLDRGVGRIVNIASVAAKAGSYAFIHYNVSKAGVVTLTRNLAVAYAKRGININCVCPGIVDTSMWEKIDREADAVLGLPPGEFTNSRLNMIALGRIETPEDVANVVSFLCSDEASYMTGQAINVEGGMIFH